MQYIYKGRTTTGEQKTGIVEAASQEAALIVLQKTGLIITEISAVGETSATKREINIFSKKVGAKDLVFFFRELSILFSAGVPLLGALSAVAEQSKNTKLREVTGKMARDIDGGMAFSAALEAHKDVFDDFTINMVKTGEAAGNLNHVLEYLAVHVEKSYKISSSIKGALYYPVFVVVIMIIVVVVLVAFVLPQMFSVFADMGATELPLPTKIVLGLSNFLRNDWLFILVILAALVFAGIRFMKTESGAKFMDFLQLKSPVFGQLLTNMYITRLCENLGTLIKSGIPIVQALETSSLVIGNLSFKNIVLAASENVKKGGTISETFKTRPKLIPPTLAQMISSGEESGRLDAVLLELGTFYDSEVNRTTENLMSLLTPVITIVLAVGVGFVAAAVILPMYSMIGKIGG